MQIGAHGTVYLRETYEQNHHRNNKPHVVGLPYRPYSLVTCGARALPVLFGCKQFNNARTKIGPAQQKVKQYSQAQKYNYYG